MMTPKKLSTLNRNFLEFGLNPHGGLNYKWGHTKDMFYLAEEESRIINPTGTGLFTASKSYSRHPYSDLYEKTWCICRWEPTVSFEAWREQYGESLPWPREGTYIPMESTFLPIGMEPDIELSVYSAFAIRRHLDTRKAAFMERAKAAVEKEKAKRVTMTGDFLDSELPAYGNVPGRKGHVLLPQRESLITI